MCHAEGSTQAAGGAAALAVSPAAGVQGDFASALLGSTMNIIMVGPPGAGKGTQANRFALWLGVPHIASGEFFRAEQRSGTPLGLEAKSYLDRGMLVPDELTSSMILERLGRPDCARGVILDGYPRTVPQARALDGTFAHAGNAKQIDKVLLLTVSEDVVLERMIHRISCANCGWVYNLESNPPRVSGICDNCGHGLSIRSDDKIATFQKRLQIYHEETWPMIQYYEERNLVTVIDGDQDIDAVSRALQESIATHG